MIKLLFFNLFSFFRRIFEAMNQEQKIDIRDLSLEEMGTFFADHGEAKYRAKQLLEWIWKKGCTDVDRMTSLSKPIRELLKNNFRLSVLKNEVSQTGSDGTVKIGFRMEEGGFVEGVLIPSGARSTACISTQAGCPLACDFCATGKLGFVRNLTAGEIFDQVVELKKVSEKDKQGSLTNIVLMGMGEPLLNYENVLKAIEHMTSPDGLGISPQRITLSTVGIADGIKRLGDDGVRFNLAVSLHTANELKRNAIMPVNKSNPLETLSKAIRYFYEKTGNRLTFEYILMKEVNDGLTDAAELARFCKAFPCKINLIEYNPVEGSRYQASTRELTEQFKTYLETRNLIVNIRKSRGKDIDAACGQLANKTRKK